MHSRVTGEEHHQTVFEIIERAVADVERRHIDLTIFGELETGQATESRDVLVLFADRLLQDVDLDFASLFGDHPGIDVLTLEGVHGAQETDGESSRRSETGAGRNIRHADYFDGRMDVMHPQRLTDKGCRISSSVMACSSAEYFRKYPPLNVSLMPT